MDVSPRECPECGTQQVPRANFCGKCQFEFTLISTHKPIVYDGWSGKDLSDQAVDRTDDERELRDKKGKVTFSGYVQPGANGYRIIPDDVSGAPRIPVEVSINRVSKHRAKYVQAKDHIQVYGKWRKHRYVEARRIKNLTTDIIVKRTFFRAFALFFLSLWLLLVLGAVAQIFFLGRGLFPNTPLLLLAAIVGIVMLAVVISYPFRDKG